MTEREIAVAFAFVVVFVVGVATGIWLGGLRVGWQKDPTRERLLMAMVNEQLDGLRLDNEMKHQQILENRMRWKQQYSWPGGESPNATGQ